MIKNIVFDIGGVLIDFNPLIFLTKEYGEQKGRELTQLIFKDPCWQDLDKGTLSFEEAIEFFSAKRPEYREDIKRALSIPFIEGYFSEKTDTVELYRELKRNGYNIYLLSNFSKEGFDHVRTIYTFLEECHGMVVSAYIKMIKPEPEIYRYLLDTFNLDPDETLFMDDLQVNIQGAIDAGIHGICFTNAAECRQIMKERFSL